MHRLLQINLREYATSPALWALALAVALTMFATALARPAYADPGSSDPVYLHCVKVLTDTKNQSACTNDQLITWARNAAYYQCKNADNPENCIVKNANKYIDEAAAKDSVKKNKPDTFKPALESVLKDAVGDKYKKSPDTESADTSSPKNDSLCVTNADKCTDPAYVSDENCDKSSCDFVKKYVNPAILVLTACFGLIAIISLIAAGIQYSSSNGDPQKIAKAKQRITNTIIAIVCYFFFFAFLQFLVPGGIFNK